MNFESVLSDIERLKGKKLPSIRRGANLTILDINIEEGRIELLNSSSVRMSRSIVELKRIWKELCSKPAIHVDSLLGGSGTSRNQPETIFANLPYIEFLYIDNKKHISLVPNMTHDYGTIREMDGIMAQTIKQRLHSGGRKVEPPSVVIVADDLQACVKILEAASGLSLTPVSPGIYKLYESNSRALVVSRSVINNQLQPYTFVVIKSTVPGDTKIDLDVDGYIFYSKTNTIVKMLIAVDQS